MPMPANDPASNSDETPQVEKASLSPDQIKGAAVQFGEALGETSPKPVAQIGQLIEKCGLPFVEKIMAETDATEAAGGLLTHDRKRRRSKGGVFFYLAKGQMDTALRAQIFPNFGKGGDGTIAPPGVDWDKRIEPMKALRSGGRSNQRTYRDAERPSGKTAYRWQQRHDRHRTAAGQGAALPKRRAPIRYDRRRHDLLRLHELAPLEAGGRRRWRTKPICSWSKAAPFMMPSWKASPSCQRAFPPRNWIIRSEKPRRWARRAAQRRKPMTHRSDREASEADGHDMTGLPPEAAEKLRQLYKAADKLRQKLAAMEDGGQEAGQKMTRRLLKQTEKQIANLRRQYEK